MERCITTGSLLSAIKREVFYRASNEKGNRNEHHRIKSPLADTPNRHS